jgi:crossover junction endodeoxyribonuclease RuvC
VQLLERLMYLRASAGDTVAIERPFVGLNGHTALELGRLWGALTATALRAGCTVVDVTPGEAKQAATGDGRAHKDAVQRVVRLTFELAEMPGEHEADAIAVALAAAGKARAEAVQCRGGG